MPSCVDCNSMRLSFNIDDPSSSVYQIGFVCAVGDSLSWTEFSGEETIVYTLRKNYSIIPSFCYDIHNGTIIDPITYKTFEFHSFL